MSASGHKNNDSKSNASRETWAAIRQEAFRQRKRAIEQRERLWQASQDLTRSAALTDRPVPAVDAHPGDRCRDSAALAVLGLAASAGGLRPVARILGGLPWDFGAAVVVAQHTGPATILPALLQWSCRLPVAFASDGGPVRAAHVYVCPPRRHVVVNADRTFSVRDSGIFQPPYPSADWLFHTLAAVYGRNAIAVVLSGSRDDGARGVVYIRHAGGAVLVQEPSTCDFASMPNSALRTNCVDAILAPDQIGGAAIQMVAAMDFALSQQQFDQPFQSNN